MPRTHYQLLGVEPNATRAAIDAGLSRRESQYRDLVRTGQRPDQRIIERVRKAHATLADPQKRAAYDRSLARAARHAAPGPAGARASWPATEPGDAGSGNSRFRAWKPLVLAVVSAVLAAGAALPAGRRALASLAAIASWFPIALLGTLAALCAAGALLLWRCASNADGPVVGHLARAGSILAIAGVGLAVYAAATGSFLRIAP